jgi:large subunit ribosomal protein L54
MIAKSKKQRRVAAKLARKAALEDPSSLVPKVPLQHQSIDLPHGEGTGKEGEEGRKAREVLTKTMRAVRRKGIKEKNFLTGMR